MDGLDAEYVEIIAEVGAERARYIAAAATDLAVQIRSEADTLGTAQITRANRASVPVLGSLPRQTFFESRLWRYQLAEAADRLAADTLHWGAPIPRCTGEEMVLHLVLHRAADAAGCPPEQVLDWPEDNSTPTQGWGDLFEYLFEDHDVLLLYQLPVENLEAARGINVAPRRWFSEFETAYPLPPRTGPAVAR